MRYEHRVSTTDIMSHYEPNEHKQPKSMSGNEQNLVLVDQDCSNTFREITAQGSSQSNAVLRFHHTIKLQDGNNNKYELVT